MEIFGLTFTAFMFWKLVALAVLAFVVNFIYTLKTGRDLTDARNQLSPQERTEATQVKQAKAIR
ncbi:hypothetical protein VARIO8X_90056 [Burkholderiales bacterium 8X]|nr:hypothetical protein VARIO8X_90056 [Burkholderiales bacterium 8X]